MTKSSKKHAVPPSGGPVQQGGATMPQDAAAPAGPEQPVIILPAEVALRPQSGSALKAPVEPVAAPEFLTLGFPLPAEIAARDMDDAIVVVRSKAERGRRRAGISFSREATELRWADIADRIDQLSTDPELVVAVKIPKPAD